MAPNPPLVCGNKDTKNKGDIMKKTILLLSALLLVGCTLPHKEQQCQPIWYYTNLGGSVAVTQETLRRYIRDEEPLPTEWAASHIEGETGRVWVTYNCKF
jgi:hypothetical protein